jgi:hypothetical protein
LIQGELLLGATTAFFVILLWKRHCHAPAGPDGLEVRDLHGTHYYFILFF